MSERHQRIKIDTFAGLFLISIGFGLYLIEYDLFVAVSFVVIGSVFFARSRYRKTSLLDSDSEK